MNAAWESLHHAALEFTSSDSIKQRLTKAFSGHLADLDLDSLPPHLRPKFLMLVERLTAVCPLRGETAVAATVRKMSNEEASSCAQEIVALMKLLGEERGRAMPSRSRNVLPLHAAEN